MTILVYLLGAACIIYALFAFQGRGPLLATLYAVATKEEKKAVKTPSLYRFVAKVFLAIGVMLLLAGLGMQFALQWLFNVVIALGILLIVIVLVVSVRSEIKRG